MGVHGGLYRVILFLHVACAIGGFGALAWNGLYLVWARRKGGAAEASALDLNGDVSRIAEFLIYAVFILGILVAVTSKTHGVMVWKFSQGWLSAAMALYIVDLGVLHGFIRRNQKEYRRLVGQLTGTAAPAGSTRPPQVAQLDQLQQRINLGWGVFNVIVLVILWLMLFGPPGR
jgi:uncharacterized membrane protein